MNTKTILVIIVVIVIISSIVFGVQMLFSDTYNDTQTDPREELSKTLAGALEHGITCSQIEEFTNAVSLFKNGRKAEAKTEFQNLSQKIGEGNLSQLTIEPPSDETQFYNGLFFNYISNARYALANIDNLKECGFDTIFLNVQMLDRPDGSLYVPGEEVYFFYINAFHASGFKIWLAPSHTAFEFPYRFNSPPHVARELDNQFDVFDIAEPVILEWAEIAQHYQVEGFIPLEEANALTKEQGSTITDMYQDERDFLSNWSQEIRSKIEPKYSGKIGFATNDGGPAERDEPGNQDLYPYPQGPDLNYTGYDFIVAKVPFINNFETDEKWLYEVENRLLSCKNYAERDGVSGGALWYEAGAPVGGGMEEMDVAWDYRIIDEEKQAYAFEKTLEYLKNISGIFFLPSCSSTCEGNWSFLGNPAEYVLKEKLTTSDEIEPKTIDELWISLGEEGLLIIQLAIAPDIPFDPDYSLDHSCYDDYYHNLELMIDGECNSYGGYGYDC